MEVNVYLHALAASTSNGNHWIGEWVRVRHMEVMGRKGPALREFEAQSFTLQLSSEKDDICAQNFIQKCEGNTWAEEPKHR